MNTRRFASVLTCSLFATVGLAIVGCATTPAPAVSVSNAIVSDRSDEATLVMLSLDIKNRASVPLPLYEFDYSVSIDGQPVFGTNRRARITLRPSETRQLTLPVVVPNTAARNASVGSSAYGINGSLVYIAPGELAEILFDTGVRVPSTPFSAKGTIELGP